MKRLFVGCLLSLLILTSCFAANSINPDVLYEKASELTKLSTVVESTVRYKNPPDNLSDDELLKLATQHDPVLLDRFSDFKVRVFQENKHSITLICTKDGARGLLEDAGCTTEMDRHLWQSETPPAPCEFSLKIEEICTP